MTIYRRRLASSFAALKATLAKRLEAITAAPAPAADQLDARIAEEDLPSDERAPEVMDLDQAEALQALVLEEADELRDLLKQASKLAVDSKARTLVTELRQGFADGFRTAIVFTQFTDTVDFLKEHLAEALEVSVGAYSGRGGERRTADGSWVKRSKQQVKRELAEEKIEVLLCTDAAGEGLNLQSCGLLVNYDLPWNPMKVEQRIGRVDRIGQAYPKVRIVNLGYADTVETDVYFALSDRIDLFHGFVGRLQPILAQLPHQLEEVTRNAGENRRQETQKLLSRLEAEADRLENGFDIDELGDQDLHPQPLPPSPVTLTHLHRLLSRPGLLPPGCETAPLDVRSHSLRPPGHARPARVTTSARTFEEQPGNQQLFSPGGPLYEAVARGTVTEGGDPEADERAWIRWVSEETLSI